MPNDCFNTLRITGPAELIATFREGISNPGDGHGQALFQSHLPMPADIPPGRQQRDWMLDNWGVDHGGDYGTVILDDPDATVLTIEFETAWRPPTQGLEALARKFPGLRFENTYDEPGNDLHGTGVYHVRGDGQAAEYDRVLGDLRNAIKRAADELDRVPPGQDRGNSARVARHSVRTLVAAGTETIAAIERRNLEQGIGR